MICIIPARKNSKGLRNKNIKKLNGIPLISHTVNLAKKSKKIKKIYISTNDKRIINLYRNDKKVIIPFLRPSNISGDKSSSLEVYLHFVNDIKKKYNENIKHFCSLLPTCPIRDPKMIDKAISIYYKKKTDFLISVVKTKPLETQFKIKKNNFLKKINNIAPSISNRQKLDQIYSPNGSIYIFNTTALKKERTFLTKNTYCFEMNKHYSQDIDDITDFNIIKKLLR